MTAIADKVNRVSRFIAELSNDPAERFSIASILVEMYRYELNKAFTPLEKKAPDAS